LWPTSMGLVQGRVQARLLDRFTQHGDLIFAAGRRRHLVSHF
jgi:hypothetical protein